MQDGRREKFQPFSVVVHRMRGGEMLPTLAVDLRASAVRDKEVECFREVAGVSIVTAGRRSMVDTLTIDSRVALINFRIKHALCIHAEATSTPILHTRFALIYGTF